VKRGSAGIEIKLLLATLTRQRFRNLTSTTLHETFVPYEDSPWIFLFCWSVSPIYATQPDFGPNVTVFDPSMSPGTIQGAVDAVSQVQALPSSQFNTARHAFLFKPGTYDVNVEVGYYTSVAGLGLSPDDVTINGLVHVEGAGGQGEPGGQNGVFGDSALVNFWRSQRTCTSWPRAVRRSAGPFPRRLHSAGCT
jgi:hypothetical protein